MRTQAAISMTLIATALACDTGSAPDDQDQPFMEATVDSVAWYGNQATRLFAVSLPDSSLMVSAVRLDISGRYDNLHVGIDNFHGVGRYPTRSSGEDLTGGGYSVSRPSDADSQFVTSTFYPGEIVITEYDPVASLVAGTFDFLAFQNFPARDTSVRHLVQGAFRMRFEVYGP